MKKKHLFYLIIITMSIIMGTVVFADQDSVTWQDNYQKYYQRYNTIQVTSQISDNGFEIMEGHVFPIETKNYGEVTVIPTIDREYDRLAIFITSADETVVHKTEQLAANYQNRGELKQHNKGFSSISFRDVNGDGLTDILFITICEDERLQAEEKTYKVGDVLFQQPDGVEALFYRDYRISDKLNQYGMNKSTKFMMSYLIEEYSTEFLYTSDTLEQLRQEGFMVYEEDSWWTEFEKWGRLQIVSGYYKMAEYTVLMVYLVNEQGYIVWSFQPMRDYECLYGLRGILCTDIDGDGLRDITILGTYIYDQTNSESVITADYSVYYQRTAGFYEDTEIKQHYPCEEEDTLTTLKQKLHTYWGWN